MRAGLVAISVPMHTALRLGEQIARRVRAINPTAHICLYGLYALLNADYLLQDTIDSAIGGDKFTICSQHERIDFKRSRFNAARRSK